MVQDKAFSSLLIDCICESVTDAMGAGVLQVLVEKGLLDNSDNPTEFDRQLRSIFGNGARVLERLVVKELFRKLGIPYRTELSFDYGESLGTAKQVRLAMTRIN
jgi:hypothetical protein